MHRPRALNLAAHVSAGKKNLRSPRGVSSPHMKRGSWQTQHYLMKFLSRKIVCGTMKSRLLIHALRKRLLRRGLNSPRAPRPGFILTDIEVETREPQSATLPILLPQLPLLSLPRLFPETDSGYCSDESRSPSPSPPTPGTQRMTRRYILPDPIACSPADLVAADEVCVRLSAYASSPRILPPLHFEPLTFDL